jgi:acid phosphatase
MHDCGVGAGDAWLSKELPKILNSGAYRSGSTAVFVTWDEDDHHSGNQIPLYVVAPSVRPGTTSAAAFQHQTVLHATEQMLGLPPLQGASGGTALRSAFHL